MSNGWAVARKLTGARSIDELRRLAQRRLPRAIFDFFDGGAQDEIVLRDNRDAFRRVRLMPRTLVDVSSVDPSVELLAASASLPMAVAPTGAAGYGWPNGDIAIAKAAVAAGIPYTLSTSATASIEEVARRAPGRLWFQAYILRDGEALAGLIERARAADYEALMITVDLPVGGKRERDFRNHLSFPFHFTPRNVLDFACHPRWSLALLRHGMPVVENLKNLRPAPADAGNKAASSVGRYYDPSFDWSRLQQLRDTWPRKLIVKGVLCSDDARRLSAMGCDAIVVSNHGGRQLDCVPASLNALSAVVQAVAGRTPVLVDGGVRRGSDIFKARALGAQGVLIGRATLYGVAAAGQCGAARAIDILREEFVRTMQLCGVPHANQIGPSALFA